MHNKINKEWLTKRTGDPFADTGGYAIDQLWKLNFLKDKPILDLIKYIAEVYVQQWGAGQLSPFFLNSTITQPSFIGDRKITETIKYFTALLEETIPFQLGYCRILGENTKLFIGARDNHLLSGSGTFINFHHAFQNGVMLSKEILIRMFFVPFGTIRLSDKIAVIDSNNDKVMQSFVQQNVKDNIRRISIGKAEGVLTSEFSNPATALFDFVRKCINNDFEEIIEEEDVEINLYHFSNFGATPEVVIHTFSAPLFLFCRRVMEKSLKEDWQKFIRSHFYNSKHKNFRYNSQHEAFEADKGQEIIEFDQYKTWINWVYQDLLNGNSILGKILVWSKKHPFNFQIVRHYQKFFKDMNDKTLDKIEQLADYIISDKNSLKKRLGALNRADKVFEVRRFLMGMIHVNHAQANEKPLFTLEEYVKYLFPDGVSGREIRDLLLISIYQKMHEQGIFFDEPIDELEPEEETTFEESN